MATSVRRDSYKSSYKGWKPMSVHIRVRRDPVTNLPIRDGNDRAITIFRDLKHVTNLPIRDGN